MDRAAERRGLGRGLGALISGALTDDGAGGVREVPLDQIRPNPFQPRQTFDERALAEMTESVREHGILQPVLLRRTGIEEYELIAGERRFRAARAAGLAAVPAIVREYADRQMLEVALIENVQRQDISPVEAALAYRRLVTEFGMTQEAVAQRVGKAPSTVTNTLRLLSLPEEILASLQRGEITEGHARAILQAGPDAQLEVWKRARAQHLSVRAVERLARETRDEPGGSRAARRPESGVRAVGGAVDPNVAAVEEALQLALGTKVTVRRTGSIGRLEIEFYSDEELEGIVDRILGDGQSR